MTEPRALLLWSLGVVALTVLLLGWTRDALQIGMLAGSAAVVVVCALLVLAARREPLERRIVMVSIGAPLLAVGLAAVLLGSVYGAWLWGPGAVAALAGLVAWVAEAKRG